MQKPEAMSESKRPPPVAVWANPKSTSAHPADKHVGRQIAIVRVQSDVSQAQLARSIGISFQQLQKYENARNRVSASTLDEIATSLGVPVRRLFEGLPGSETSDRAPPLPVDERIDFVTSAEGRRLIEGLMHLHPRVRRRVSALIAALGDELKAMEENRDSTAAGEAAAVHRDTLDKRGTARARRRRATGSASIRGRRSALRFDFGAGSRRPSKTG